MDFDEFRERTERAEKRAASGDDHGALAVLTELASSEGLPDLDRAVTWAHAAGAHDRLGETDLALAAFDRAIALEAPHKRFSAAFKKADYLLRLGRKDESRELFSSLRDRAESTLAERASIESRLKLLRRVGR